MLNRLLNTRSNRVKKYFIFLCAIISSGVFAQPKTNLDIFYSLIDSSVYACVSQIPGSVNSVKLELNLGESFNVFGNKINAGLLSSGKIITGNDKNAVKINYVIDNAEVVYGEIYRDGLFGDYYIPRTLSVKGNFLVQNTSGYFQEFKFSANDSIDYDEVSLVENESYPFTKGELPAEPFFSGLFEPIVAIGTAALAVILFFTIRSK